jgi:hypothetical protein
MVLSAADKMRREDARTAACTDYVMAFSRAHTSASSRTSLSTPDHP